MSDRPRPMRWDYFTHSERTGGVLRALDYVQYLEGDGEYEELADRAYEHLRAALRFMQRYEDLCEENSVDGVLPPDGRDI